MSKKTRTETAPVPDPDPAPAARNRRSPKATVAITVFGLFAVVAVVLFALSRPAAVPAAADGVQRIKIDTSGGEFLPNAVRAKAGSPIELEFPPGGSGCSASITFPDLDVSSDLSRGGIVKLPALQPGVYAWKGGCGSESGDLTVE